MNKPTYAEIDLSAIRDNVTAIRERVGYGVKIMPAVKANGYGHGAVEVSQACLDGGADVLGVSSIHEAIELRDAGYEIPILILGCSVPEAVEPIVQYYVSATVCDVGFAKILSDAAVKFDKSARVHIKIDTGMGRIGVRPEEAVELAQTIASLPGLLIEGVFTHFPCSDEEDRSFTLSQTDTFRNVAIQLKRGGIEAPILHTSNSGAILAYPESDFNAVRPGIMIYGYYPSRIVPRSISIREALTLKTRIVFLKEIERGTSVSYGRTYTTKRKSKVATLPIGYADGYSRALSNRGLAAIRGCKAPVIGRICMDQCLVDVTDVPGVELGDEVILYGGGYDFLSVTAIADMLGTISYEVLCDIGKRVPRVYVNG